VINTDLSKWEQELPKALQYRDDEMCLETKLFAAMLIFALQ
jgi:hypothetical protein